MRGKLKLLKQLKASQERSTLSRKWAVVITEIPNHSIQWETLMSPKVKISEWISHITKSEHLNCSNTYDPKDLSQ